MCHARPQTCYDTSPELNELGCGAGTGLCREVQPPGSYWKDPMFMEDTQTVAHDVGREQARLQALHSLGLMGSAPEERFDRITRMACELFGVPVAAVNMLDDRNLFIKSPQLPGLRTMDRSNTFCDVTISSPELLVVDDAATDARFADLPDVAGGRGVRFYAGRPLSINGEHRVGTLCLFDTKSRELSAEDRRLLDELGTWAERELADSMDLDRAHEVQQALLPATSPGAPAFEVAGTCLPARSVGGDFYSWTETGGSIDLTLADVMGKGTAAALVAATVRSAVLAAGELAPAETMEAVSEAVENDLEVTGIFATMFRARLDLASGHLVFADAGHGLTMIVKPDGSYRQLRAPGLPMGLGSAGCWETGTAEVAPGEMLLSFTDGLLDLYCGTLDALADIAGLVRLHPGPAAFMDALRALLPEGSRTDDTTVIAVRRAL